MNKIYKTIIFVMACVIIFAGAYLIQDNTFSQRTEYTNSGVIEKIKAVNKLNTVEMYFNEIIDYKNARYFRDFQIPFTEKTFIFTVKGRVQAGVDLENLSEEDILIDGKKLAIKLETPIVTSNEILETKSYHEKDGLFNEITNDDTLKALEQFKIEMEKQAIENGIIEKARGNAKVLIENLFISLGFEKVSIEWR